MNSSNSVVVKTSYDASGNVTLLTDEVGSQTKHTYGQISGVLDLYPTITEEAFGVSGVERTQTMVWDFSGGVPVTQTDSDNNITTTLAYDTLGRQTSVTEASQRKIATTYDDANRKITTKRDLFTLSDGKLQTVTHYDQLGRVRLTRQSDGAALSTSGETDGIKVKRVYRTASGGNCDMVSNPHRQTSDPTMGWTRTRFDQPGRVTEVATFSGPNEPSPPCTDNSSRLGYTTSTYGTSGSHRLVTAIEMGSDNDKKREFFSDGLGRLKSVKEYYSGSSSYTTNYIYSALDDLTQVLQGSQTRAFTYSSLSRLAVASNPESGFTTYTYYDDGQLNKKKDARNITATFSYDALKRPTLTTYSDFAAPDPTPWVSYTYGSAAPNIGRLTRVLNLHYVDYGYDTLGRVTTSAQNTNLGTLAAPDFQTFAFSYEYQLNDELKKITYPAGRVIDYTHRDFTGQPITVASNSATRASLMTYGPHGALEQLKFGVSAPEQRWEYRDYNRRLQTSEVGLGTMQGGADLLKLTYAYGLTNNGNPHSQQIIAEGGFNKTQYYNYDGVNRLIVASEGVSLSGSATTCPGGVTWCRQFTYDQYGNRTLANNVNLPTTPGINSWFLTQMYARLGGCG